MAGTFVRLVPFSTYTWTSLQAGFSQQIALADNIDLTRWKEGHVLYRIHGNTNITSTATAALDFYLLDPAPDDPATTFAQDTVTTSLNSATMGPLILAQTIMVSQATLGRLMLTMTAASGAFTGQLGLSVDLVLKTPG